MKHFLPFLLFPFLLTACKERSNGFPDNQILASLIKNQQTISEISMTTKNGEVDGIEVLLGEENVYIEENADALWFYFYANEGDLYQVSWQDSWWEQYSAGSIWVTAYENDQTNTYFERDRLIQLVGSPKTISVAQSGPVYLKIEGFNGEISGSFSITVDELNKESAVAISPNESINDTISAGEVKLYKFSVLKDSVYQISLAGSKETGAYGDQVEVNFTAMRAGHNDNYFSIEYALPPIDSMTNIQSFIAKENEEVYLSVIGGYWWQPRPILLKLL